MTLNKYNSDVTGFNFQTPKEFTFTNLKDLYENDTRDQFLIKSMFINTKGRYGDNPVIVTDQELVNIPAHMLDTVRNMIQDDDVVHLVNDNRVYFTIYEYQNNWGTHYSIRFKEELPF